MNNSLILNGSIHSYAIRTYNKRKGPYYLLRVEENEALTFVKKLDDVNHMPSKVANQLISRGNELFKEVEKTVPRFIKRQ